MSKTTGAIICGSGAALPEQVITNHDLEQLVDTSDQWILSRTGIRERRRLEENRAGTDLAYSASIEALEQASITAGDLDLIIVATVTPDHPTPSSSCLLQARLEADQAAAFDISAGCSGFIYALVIANQFISNGIYKNILVVGVEVLTRVTDWQDRSTCVLFGDGAGAFVLQANEEDRGILDFTLNSDGKGSDLLIIPGGGNKIPANPESIEKRLHYIKMKGNEVFKFATRAVEDTLAALLDNSGVTPDCLDYLFLHQANLRIIENVRKRLKIPPAKVPINIDRYGNMSSATIPIAVHEEIQAGRLQRGALVAMIAFGSGLTWGGLLIKW